MVAGMLRHLSSLRKLKSDNGWIETLLEESYNERMVCPPQDAPGERDLLI